MLPTDIVLPLIGTVSVETTAVMLTAAASFLAVVAIWWALVERDPTGARIRLVMRRRDELRQAVLNSSTTKRRRALPGSVRQRLVQALRLAQASKLAQINDRLAAAGLRAREALPVYLMAQVTLPVGAMILGYLFIFVAPIVDLQPLLRPVAVAALVLLGFYAPDLYVSRLAAQRRHALQRSLPDGLDLLVICAEAGLSLDAALLRVAEELGGSHPELAEEFGLTSAELGFLPERRQALQNLARRTDLPAIRAVVGTLGQTERYGTPLAQSLRVLAAEFREQRMLKAEEKAARLPAILTVPMIVFILPTLFVVLIGPAMLDVYDQLINR